MHPSVSQPVQFSTVVFGALNMDLVVETERPAKPGETFVGKRFYTAPGGKGANQAVAAARFARKTENGGVQVAMVGAVGDDIFGRQLVSFMDDEGIDASRVSFKSGVSSGIAVIFTDDDGENYVNPVYGANTLCGASEVLKFEELAKSDAPGTLLVQQEVPLEATMSAMRIAQNLGIAVVLDPAPARRHDEIPDGFYAGVDVLTPNETEAEALSGVVIDSYGSAESSARRIRSRWGPRNVVVTMGANGALALIDGDAHVLQAHEVEVVASVAAGDAFAGVLGQALAEGCGLLEAMDLGMAAGAACVTKPGAQEAMPTRSEVFAIAADGINGKHGLRT